MTKDALEKMGYNGLADKYLKHFFARDSQRKVLKKTGVIDKYGNLNVLDDIRKND